jgi:hypothetical protein
MKFEVDFFILTYQKLFKFKFTLKIHDENTRLNNSIMLSVDNTMLSVDNTQKLYVIS